MADELPQIDRFGGSELPPPPAAGLRAGPPWEARGYSVETFLATARQALLEPGQFFGAMRREGGLGAPLVYGLIGFTLGLVVSSVVQTALPTAFLPREFESMVGDLAVMGGLIVVSPFIALVSLFVTSAITHVMLMLLGGAKTFETTFRVVGYSAGSTGLVAIVPFCGGVISAVWQVVLTIIGIARAHEVSTGKAAAAVLLPTLLCCMIVVITFGAIVAMIAAGIGALGRT